MYHRTMELPCNVNFMALAFTFQDLVKLCRQTNPAQIKNKLKYLAQFELKSSQPWRYSRTDCSPSKCGHKLKYVFIQKLLSFEVKSIELIVTHSSLVNSEGALGMMILLLAFPINLIFGFISTQYSDMLVDDASIIC